MIDLLFCYCVHKNINDEDIESLVDGVNHKVECSTTNLAGAVITKISNKTLSTFISRQICFVWGRGPTLISYTS